MGVGERPGDDVDMRMWRDDLEQTGLTIEELVPGAPIDGAVFIEFHCPGCSEFHSISCDCDRDETSAFFCSCVPDGCPSCRVPFGPDVVHLEEDMVHLEEDMVHLEEAV